MSPVRRTMNDTDVCFPRVSGDEPCGLSAFWDFFKFSPRERG